MKIIPGHSYMYIGTTWFHKGTIIVAMPHKSPRGNHKFYDPKNIRQGLGLYITADEIAPIEAENE